MNDNMVMAKLDSTGYRRDAEPAEPGAGADRLTIGLISMLYMNILSRYPTTAEQQHGATLCSASGNRTQKAQELMWTLYNKVDFMFNY